MTGIVEHAWRVILAGSEETVINAAHIEVSHGGDLLFMDGVTIIESLAAGEWRRVRRM